MGRKKGRRKNSATKLAAAGSGRTSKTTDALKPQIGGSGATRELDPTKKATADNDGVTTTTSSSEATFASSAKKADKDGACAMKGLATAPAAAKKTKKSDFAATKKVAAFVRNATATATQSTKKTPTVAATKKSGSGGDVVRQRGRPPKKRPATAVQTATGKGKSDRYGAPAAKKHRKTGSVVGADATPPANDGDDLDDDNDEDPVAASGAQGAPSSASTLRRPDDDDATAAGGESYIDITCGDNKARMHLRLRLSKKERCRQKCIQFGDAWLTPNEFQAVSGRSAAKDWKRTIKHGGLCIKALVAAGLLIIDSQTAKCLCQLCTTSKVGVSTIHMGGDHRQWKKVWGRPTGAGRRLRELVQIARYC